MGTSCSASAASTASADGERRKNGSKYNLSSASTANASNVPTACGVKVGSCDAVHAYGPVVQVAAALQGRCISSKASDGCMLPDEALSVPLTCTINWLSPLRGYLDEGRGLQRSTASLSCILLGSWGEWLTEVRSEQHKKAEENGLWFEEEASASHMGKVSVHILGLQHLQANIAAIGFVLRAAPSNDIDLDKDGDPGVFCCSSSLSCKEDTSKHIYSLRSSCPVGGSMLLAALVRQQPLYGTNIKGGWRFEMSATSSFVVEDDLRKLLGVPMGNPLDCGSSSGPCSAALGRPDAEAAEATVLREELVVVQFMKKRLLQESGKDLEVDRVPRPWDKTEKKI